MGHLLRRGPFFCFSSVFWVFVLNVLDVRSFLFFARIQVGMQQFHQFRFLFIVNHDWTSLQNDASGVLLNRGCRICRISFVGLGAVF